MNAECPKSMQKRRDCPGHREAERGRERFAELGDGVDEGVEGEELRVSDRVGYLRLAKSDLNLGEAGLTEDTLIYRRLVLHADPNKERAKWLLFPSVGEGDGVDRGSHDAARVGGTYRCPYQYRTWSLQ